MKSHSDTYEYYLVIIIVEQRNVRTECENLIRDCDIQDPTGARNANEL